MRRYQYRRGHDIPRYIVAVQNTVKRHKCRVYRRELATHYSVFYNLSACFRPILHETILYVIVA